MFCTIYSTSVCSARAPSTVVLCACMHMYAPPARLFWMQQTMLSSKEKRHGFPHCQSAHATVRSSADQEAPRSARLMAPLLCQRSSWQSHTDTQPLASVLQNLT